MKALTLKRKWAEKILDRSKRFEVRNFKTTYRGPIVITISKEKIAYCVVNLVDIVPSADVPELTDEERAYGKWAWKFGAVHSVPPIPCKGKLGLWEWNQITPLIAYQLLFE